MENSKKALRDIDIYDRAYCRDIDADETKQLITYELEQFGTIEVSEDEIHSEIFFPGVGEERKSRLAKAICGMCEVREACLRQFIDEEYGVFGGKTPTERKRIREG